MKERDGCTEIEREGPYRLRSKERKRQREGYAHIAKQLTEERGTQNS